MICAMRILAVVGISLCVSSTATQGGVIWLDQSSCGDWECQNPANGYYKGTLYDYPVAGADMFDCALGVASNPTIKNICIDTPNTACKVPTPVQKNTPCRGYVINSYRHDGLTCYVENYKCTDTAY